MPPRATIFLSMSVWLSVRGVLFTYLSVCPGVLEGPSHFPSLAYLVTVQLVGAGARSQA